jgi:predicted RNA-binding protein with PIN domain
MNEQWIILPASALKASARGFKIKCSKRRRKIKNKLETRIEEKKGHNGLSEL